MAGQFAYSNASGEIILKGILQKLDITISQLEKETGLSYSSLQRIYNGETKKITMPVYEGIKARYPNMRDEYLRDATLPIFDGEEADTQEEQFNNIDILNLITSARQILKSAERKEESLKEWEIRLDERSKMLDARAAELDAIMRLVVSSQIEMQAMNSAKKE